MAEETENVNVQDSDKQAVKSSLMKKGRKSIAYLQKKKDNGEKIVQYCPAHLDPYWTMAAEMAGVDIVRYTAPGENYRAPHGESALVDQRAAQGSAVRSSQCLYADSAVCKQV